MNSIANNLTFRASLKKKIATIKNAKQSIFYLPPCTLSEIERASDPLGRSFFIERRAICPIVKWKESKYWLSRVGDFFHQSLCFGVVSSERILCKYIGQCFTRKAAAAAAAAADCRVSQSGTMHLWWAKKGLQCNVVVSAEATEELPMNGWWIGCDEGRALKFFFPFLILFIHRTKVTEWEIWMGFYDAQYKILKSFLDLTEDHF